MKAKSRLAFASNVRARRTNDYRTTKDRGGGQVVSILAYYSDDPSSNPAKNANCFVKLYMERTKINKRARGCPLKNQFSY